MDFLEQIKDMAKAAAVKSEEFAKTVGKKAEAAMEIQKLSSEMEEKERFINDNYRQMGMELYKRASKGEAAPDYLHDYCKLIDTALLEMDELQDKIDLIKQQQFGAAPTKVLCPNCGAEVLASSKFCSECGSAMKQEAADNRKAAGEQDGEEKEAVTDETMSAETITKVPTEADAVAEADKQEEKAPLVAEAQPEQVKNTEAADVSDSAKEVVDSVVQEAETVAQETNQKANAPAAEAIIDAEIVEPASSKVQPTIEK